MSEPRPDHSEHSLPPETVARVNAAARAFDRERPAVRQPASEPASEQVARMFHEAYERLAPEHSYETRRESAVPWEQVPENNRRLMIAVAEEVLAALAAARGDTP